MDVNELDVHHDYLGLTKLENRSAMHRLGIYLLCVFATCGFEHVNGQLYRNVSRLMEQLLDGYDKRLRPVINQSHPVTVNVSFELLALQVSVVLGLNNTFKVCLYKSMWPLERKYNTSLKQIKQIKSVPLLAIINILW